MMMMEHFVLQLDPHQEVRKFKFPKLFMRVSGCNNPKAYKSKATQLDQADLVDRRIKLEAYYHMVGKL